jgi:hypothetical protein
MHYSLYLALGRWDFYLKIQNVISSFGAVD